MSLPATQLYAANGAAVVPVQAPVPPMSYEVRKHFSKALSQVLRHQTAPPHSRPAAAILSMIRPQYRGFTLTHAALLEVASDTWRFSITQDIDPASGEVTQHIRALQR